VDDAFRASLKKITTEQGARATREVTLKQKDRDFHTLRDRAWSAIDAKNPDEAHTLCAQAVALSEELEKLDSGHAAMWMLKRTELFEGLYGRAHGKGIGPAAADFAERGVPAAEAAFAAEPSEAARTAMAKTLRNFGDLRRITGRHDEAVAAYTKALPLFETPQESKLSTFRAERAIEMMLDWTQMELQRKKPAEAKAALDHALDIQKKLLAEGPGSRDALRAFFDDAPRAVEPLLSLRGEDAARVFMKETFALLDAQRARDDLDASKDYVLVRFVDRMREIVQRQERAALSPRPELGRRMISWLELVTKKRPLNDEEKRWHDWAESWAREQPRK
jgi:tetratricopeptide (TPR) repeat protein